MQGLIYLNLSLFILQAAGPTLEITRLYQYITINYSDNIKAEILLP